MNKKSIILSIICIIGLFCFTGCNTDFSDKPVNVITTSEQIYDAVSYIGDEYIDIKYIETDDEYKPSVSDIDIIRSSDCFIYSGNIDKWVYEDIYSKVITHSIFVDTDVIDVDINNTDELVDVILTTLCTIDTNITHQKVYQENANNYLE